MSDGEGVSEGEVAGMPAAEMVVVMVTTVLVGRSMAVEGATPSTVRPVVAGGDDMFHCVLCTRAKEIECRRRGDGGAFTWLYFGRGSAVVVARGKDD